MTKRLSIRTISRHPSLVLLTSIFLCFLMGCSHHRQLTEEEKAHLDSLLDSICYHGSKRYYDDMNKRIMEEYAKSKASDSTSSIERPSASRPSVNTSTSSYTSTSEQSMSHGSRDDDQYDDDYDDDEGLGIYDDEDGEHYSYGSEYNEDNIYDYNNYANDEGSY